MSLKIEYEKKPYHEWPLSGLIIVYVLSFFIAAMLLPSLDGWPNTFRLMIYACISLLFWIRIVIAKLKREKNRAYIFYSVMMIGHVFFIWPLQDLLEKMF